MLRKLWCILVTGVATSVFFPMTVVCVLFGQPDASVWVARRLWAPVLLWAGGARLVVSGLENVDPKRPTIYVSNHQSTLDIPAHFASLAGVNYRYVAKHQLKYVPLIGWYLWLAGHVFVNRGQRDKAIASLDAAARRIRAGTSVFLYPEGTRSDDGRVLPFKKGPFALALKARVPVVPITIEGSGTVMPKNSWDITPGPVHVKIGKPIDTTLFDAEDREGLARAVRDVIIAQSLELGGKGGDSSTATAAAGVEGEARPRQRTAS